MIELWLKLKFIGLFIIHLSRPINFSNIAMLKKLKNFYIQRLSETLKVYQGPDQTILFLIVRL